MEVVSVALLSMLAFAGDLDAEVKVAEMRSRMELEMDRAWR
jgi:hypothetical protein